MKTKKPNQRTRIKDLEALVERYRQVTQRMDEEIAQKRKRIEEQGLTINKQQFVISETRKAAGLEYEDGVSLSKHVKYLRDFAKWRSGGVLP
jgi:predicted Zn-dependent protease